MKPSSLISSITLALLQWTVPSQAAAQSADEAAIRQAQVQQAEAWNRHEAQGGQWLITAFQNTNSIPERAFPKPSAPTRPNN